MRKYTALLLQCVTMLLLAACTQPLQQTEIPASSAQPSVSDSYTTYTFTEYSFALRQNYQIQSQTPTTMIFKNTINQSGDISEITDEIMLTNNQRALWSVANHRKCTLETIPLPESIVFPTYDVKICQHITNPNGQSSHYLSATSNTQPKIFVERTINGGGQELQFRELLITLQKN